MSKTMENLMNAFAGESQANRKYLAFAKKAEQDGFKQIAKLFRSAAEAETVHALAHLRVADGIKSTEENLLAAIEGEGHEFNVMYPEFIKEAETEGNKAALTTFNNANAVEKVHFDLYTKALETLKGGNDLPETDIHVCPICGYTVEGEVPDNCPICKVPKDKFMKID